MAIIPNDVYQGIGVTISGDGKEQKVKVPYIVHGRQRGPLLVRRLIADHVRNNSVLAGMKIDDIEITEVSHGIENDDGDVEGCVWEGSVSLVAVEKKEEEERENQFGLQSRSFDTSAGSVNITHGDERWVTSYVAKGQEQAIDYKGAINVSKNDGKIQVNGIDVYIPTLKFSEQWNVHAAYVTPQYIKAISSMTGTVNAGGWRGFSGGASLSFNFDTSQNLYNQNVGGIEVAMKKGWDVMSVIHGEEVDSEKGNIVVPKVQQVDVIPVYQRTNFTILGI